MGQRGILPSVSVSEFSRTLENLLAFISAGSCRNPHQQQAGVDNTTENLLLSAGKALLARSVALTFLPLIFQKGKQAQADVGDLQWVSLHVSAGAWLGTHEHSSKFLGPLPTPAGRHVHSMFIELQADRQPENIPRPPSPPSSLPPSSQHIFSQSFPLASPVVLGSCQTPATLWEAGPPIPKPNKWEKENGKKKRKRSKHT